MQHNTGTGNCQNLKEIFVFIWEMGTYFRNDARNIDGTGHVFLRFKVFLNGNLDMLRWCSGNTM